MVIARHRGNPGRQEPRVSKLQFLTTASNAILVGTSGLGKSTIARNIAHRAVLSGHTVLFATAGQLLGDLAAIDSDSALRRRLRHYAAPALLVIDLCSAVSNVESRGLPQT
jgi:DNA replication protein DnaC